MKYLMHYGLQRSGTNYLDTLLRENYQIKLLNSDKDRKHPRQKHFRLYENKDLIGHSAYQNNLTFNSFAEYEEALNLSRPVNGFIVISKDPYSWYLSYQNWAMKCDWPNVPFNYVEEYVRFYQKWMEFSKQDDRITFVRYQDLLTDTQNELKKLEVKFELKLRLIKQVLGVKKVTSSSKVAQSSTFSSDRHDYYSNKEYLKEIDKRLLEEINNFLMPELMSFLGYEIHPA